MNYSCTQFGTLLPHLHAEPVFRFTQDVVTACESEGVAMVFGIELVSSTLAIPIDITIEIDNVLNTLTFPSGSVPNSNTTLNLITTLAQRHQSDSFGHGNSDTSGLISIQYELCHCSPVH